MDFSRLYEPWLVHINVKNTIIIIIYYTFEAVSKYYVISNFFELICYKEK